MSLIKHSERSVRAGCSKCGNKDLYWFHDTNVTSGGRPMAGKTCERCKVRGGLFLATRSGVIHDCQGKGKDKETIEDGFPVLPCDTCGQSVTVQGPDYNWHLPSNVVSVTCDGDWDTCHEIGGHRLYSDWLAAGKPASLHESAKPAETPKEHSTKVEAKGDDAGAALWAIIEPHAKLTADAEGIDQMVADAWAKRAMPTIVKVDNGKGDPKAIEGSVHAMLPLLIQVLSVGEHAMMVGPAGTGKSTLAEQAAEALEAEYYAISLSPQTPASALLGYMDANGNYVESLFRKWYERGGVFHFDEMDNAHPSILATINAALANGQMAFPNGMVKRHATSIACGSANTYGRGADRQYVGRSPIDAATLDRFFILVVDYDEALEDALCAATGYDAWASVLTVVRGLRQNATSQAMNLVVSPRASMGICKLLAGGGKWKDAVDGRLRRGLSDSDWRKLSDGVKVSL